MTHSSSSQITNDKHYFSSLITLFHSEMCHITEVNKLHMTIHVDFKGVCLSICMWIRGSDSCVALLQSSPSGEGAGGDTTPFSCSREPCAIVMLLHRKHSTCIHPIRHTAQLTRCMHTQTNNSDTRLFSFPTILSRSNPLGSDQQFCIQVYPGNLNSLRAFH